MESQTSPWYLQGLGENYKWRTSRQMSKYLITSEIKYGSSSFLNHKPSLRLRRPCSNLALSDPSKYCTRKWRVHLFLLYLQQCPASWGLSNTCMWTREPISPSSNHIPHTQLLLGPLPRPRRVPTGCTVLEVGSGPLDQELWVLRMLSRSGKRGASSNQATQLSPAYSLPHWGGWIRAGPSKMGEPGQLPFLPESKDRTGEEITDTVIWGKDPTELREQSTEDIWGKNAVDSRNSNCTSPEIGTCLVCSRSIKETRVAGVAQVKGREGGVNSMRWLQSCLETRS